MLYSYGGVRSDFKIKKTKDNEFESDTTLKDIYIFDTGKKGEVSSIHPSYSAARYMERNCNEEIKNFSSTASFKMTCRCNIWTGKYTYIE